MIKAGCGGRGLEVGVTSKRDASEKTLVCTWLKKEQSSAQGLAQGVERTVYSTQDAQALNSRNIFY
jgi:hypothetical protein